MRILNLNELKFLYGGTEKYYQYDENSKMWHVFDICKGYLTSFESEQDAMRYVYSGCYYAFNCTTRMYDVFSRDGLTPCSCSDKKDALRCVCLYHSYYSRI